MYVVKLIEKFDLSSRNREKYKKMFRTCLLIALFGVAFGGVVDFRTCKGKPTPNEVRIEGCDKQPCKLIRGKDANMEMDFTAGKKLNLKWQFRNMAA